MTQKGTDISQKGNKFSRIVGNLTSVYDIPYLPQSNNKIMYS